MTPVQNFTVGNTITIAVAIYRNNFKKFLKLSLIAHLWLFVPIYGWARYFAIAAWTSKLSFDELTNKVNKPDKKQYFTLYSLFTFFTTSLISIVVPFILGYLLTVVIFMFIEVIRTILALTFSLAEYDMFNSTNTAYPVIALIVCLIFVLSSSWFYTKIFVSDLIAIDSKKRHVLYLINQSRRQVKHRQFKTLKTIILSSIISLPVWIVGLLIYIFLVAMTAIVAAVISTDAISANQDLAIYVYLFLGLFIAHGLLFPFWQSVKAVTFYQLTDLERRYSLR